MSEVIEALPGDIRSALAAIITLAVFTILLPYIVALIQQLIGTAQQAQQQLG